MKRILGLFVLIIIWIIFSTIFQNQIPYPNEVFLNFIKIFPTLLWKPTLESVPLLFSGLLLAVTIGTHIGLIMGLSKKVNQILDPVVYSLYPIPKAALFQVFIIVFTSLFWMKTALIFIIVLFPVIVTVKDAVRNIPIEVFYHAKSLSLNKKDMYKEILIPAILPNLLSTTRISIGTSIAVLYLSEIRGIGSGLGYFISRNSGFINNLNMFTGIFELSLIGYLLFIGVDVLEKKLCKWI